MYNNNPPDKKPILTTIITFIFIILAISIDGDNKDQKEAAIITPDANPKRERWIFGFKSFFMKKTHAAPNAVPANGISKPCAISQFRFEMSILSPNYQVTPKISY